MTKVSFVSGLPNQSNFKRVGYKSVPKAKRIDYAYLSEGELRLSLFRERMELLEKFYPDNPEYATYRKALDQSLEVGIHREGANLSGIGALPIQNLIAEAQRMDSPAVSVSSGWFGLGSVENECREEKAAFANAQAAFMRSNLFNKKKKKRELDSAIEALDKCTGLLQLQQILNDHLEDSSHHLLYNFLPNANSVSQIVATKYVNHRIAVDNFAKVSGLSKANITEWITNGIMRSNAKKGIEPFDPIQTINIMATEAQEGASVNGPFVLAIPKIVAVIAAALSATTALINSLQAQKRMELTANLQGLGTPSFGPEWPVDFEVDQGGGVAAGGEIDYLSFIIGGAALLLLSK